MISRQALHLIHIPSGILVFFSPSSFLRNSRMGIFGHLNSFLRDRTNRRRASGPVRDAPRVSTTLTQALPTTAASAVRAAALAIPGVEMPNPTAMGREVCSFTALAHAEIPGGSAFRAPVMPVKDIRYRNPEPNATARRIRSGPLVGETRGTQSRPARRISGSISGYPAGGRSTTRPPSAPAARASRQNRLAPYRKNGL